MVGPRRAVRECSPRGRRPDNVRSYGMGDILEIVGVAVVIIVVLQVILGSLALLWISTVNPHFMQRNK